MKKTAKRGIIMLSLLTTAGILLSCTPGDSDVTTQSGTSKPETTEARATDAETTKTPEPDEPDETGYKFTEQTGAGVYPATSLKKKTAEKYDAYLSDTSTLPVSFVYDGKSYNGIQTGDGAPFKEISRSAETNGNKVSTTVIYEFIDNIEVTLLSALYPDYCAYEWTLYFENKGETKTKVLEKLNCADLVFEGENPVLKGIYGDGGANGSTPYAEYEFQLKDKQKIHMTPETGRATYNYFPYFNVLHGNGGTFAAVGWPIAWGADFDYVNENGAEGVHFSAYQQYFQTYLKPGEKVRSPLLALLEYEGRDADVSANLWRHWFMDCNMRKIDGQLFETNVSGYTGTMYGEMTFATEENQLAAMQKFLDNEVPLTYWWMDAGWYFESGTKSLTSWTATGTWMVDTTRFPSKLKAISDKAAENNMKTLLWFEPEVVRIPENQRDKENGIPLEYMLCPVLADFGNPDFIDWMLDRVTMIITEGGISLYRQDYGIDPLYYFNQTNSKDRVGIRENLYAEGYYTYWDKLIERFPSMMIDSCAAGGGRNDIESMRRAVPIHKTDHDYANTSDKQSMHQALYNWFPYFGTNLTGNVVDDYIMRTNFTPWVNLNLNINSKILKWTTMSEKMYEWQTIAKYYYCDYYEITKWADGDAAWRGWEFFSPDDNEGFIQMFRPKDAEGDVYRIKMKGLDENTVYDVRNVDTGVTITENGKDLMQNGFDVELSPRSTALFTFSKNG